MKPICSTLSAVSYLVVLLGLTACIDGGSGTGSGSESGTDGTYFPTVPENAVCDAFNDGNSLPTRGLVGELVYLNDDQPRYTTADQYIEFGQPTNVSVILNQLFIPTRPWDFGFTTNEGHTVLNQNGDPLYEYFGMRLNSRVKLKADDEPGYYQFAILSDDGSVLRSDGEIVINNDGTHATKMGCTDQVVYMDAETTFPIEVTYYQGPRFHISLVLLWKRYDSPSDVVLDPHCGTSGNSRFFDSTQSPPAPRQAYLDLLNRGYEPLEANNFHLPEEFDENPCAEEAPLTWENMSVQNISQTGADVVWSTNIPTSESVKITNVGTGAIQTTAETNNESTIHRVTLTGLTSNTLYKVQGISRSPGGQEIVTTEFSFRTFR